MVGEDDGLYRDGFLTEFEQLVSSPQASMRLFELVFTSRTDTG